MGSGQSQRPLPGKGGFFPFPRKPSNPAKEAAGMRYDQAKSNYFNALKKAKTKPGTFMPETVNPGFAQNPDDLYLPKVINAPDEKNKLKITKINSTCYLLSSY